MMAVTRRDQYLGAMVGTLVGDAMGAPVEWWTPEKVAEYFAGKGGYVFHDYLDPWAIRQGRTPRTIGAGQPTDDSELSAALAQSLVAKRGFDPEDAYYRLRDFIHGNSPDGKRKSILTARAYGKGGTLADALKTTTYAESCKRFDAGEVSLLPSNGSLMRCIGVPLAFVDQGMPVVIEMARRQSLVTHRNPLSVAACEAFSIFVTLILLGFEPQSAWNKTCQMCSPDPRYAEVVNVSLSRPDYKTEMVGVEGGAVLSLRIALWASITATSFRDGIEKAISVGGDTDTYAAIAGGILGAHFGYQAIPPEWKSPLQGREIMEHLASGLYELAHR